MKKEAARTVSTIPVAPTTLYLAWLNPEQHAAMTNGGAAKIDQTVGAKYSSHGGYVSGKLLVLDLGRRIIVSWRTTDFPREAPDSRVEIHLEALGASTRVTVLHTEIPEGLGEKTKAYWTEQYLDPMRRYFSKFLPDPRKPPPPRPPPPPIDDSDDSDDVDESPPKTGRRVRPEWLEKRLAKRRLEQGPSVAKAPASSVALPSKPSKAAPPAPPPPAPPKAAPKAAPTPEKKPAKAAPTPAPKASKAPAAPKKAAAKPTKKPAKPVPKKPAKPAAKKAAKPAAKKASKPVAKKPAAKKKPAPPKKKKR